MVLPKIHDDAKIFFYSTTASPVVPHLGAHGCYPATKEVALVLNFPQTFFDF